MPSAGLLHCIVDQAVHQLEHESQNNDVMEYGCSVFPFFFLNMSENRGIALYTLLEGLSI